MKKYFLSSLLFLFAACAQNAQSVAGGATTSTTEDESNTQGSIPTAPTEKMTYHFGFIGESHSLGTFGVTLAKHLSQIGSVERFAVGGSSTFYWAASTTTQFKWGYAIESTPHNRPQEQDVEKGTEIGLSSAVMARFLSQTPKNIIIIQLMDNQLKYSVSKNKESVRDLLRQVRKNVVADSMCFYVSTVHKDKAGSYASITNSDKLQFVENVLKPVLQEESCTLINSQNLLSLSEVTTTDGLHVTDATAKLWAYRVFKVIERQINE